MKIRINVEKNSMTNIDYIEYVLVKFFNLDIDSANEKRFMFHVYKDDIILDGVEKEQIDQSIEHSKKVNEFLYIEQI